MVTQCKSFGLFGLESFLVEVEADIRNGMQSFDIVGLPDMAVKESKDRVRLSIKNSGFNLPNGKIVVNLAPADMRKEGPIYDLPICIAILQLMGIVNKIPEDSIFIGELSLSGKLRNVKGVLPMSLQAGKIGYKNIFVPFGNAKEAAVASDISVYPVENVLQLVNHLNGKKLIKRQKYETEDNKTHETILDFADVKGQREAKRAVEVAAAGGHNILLIGSPGSGKSMIAKRISTILPNMSFEESIETTKIHSIAGNMKNNYSLITSRPFRSPHHTVSSAGLSGGGAVPRPGEVSLAHNGVLFLDELPEFSRHTLEVLRQPIEDGEVTISRVSGSLTYPCNVMLVGAMNPCECGYFGHSTRKCTCNPNGVSRYLAKISGPLLDRLDLHIEVLPVEYDELSSTIKEETSQEIKKRVDKARKIQLERYKDKNILSNSRLNSSLIKEHCYLDDNANKILKLAFERMGLSARAYDRIVKVARTIADLEGSEIIKSDHIAEAIQYRSLDRKYWNKI